MTPEQLREARRLLGWSADRLAAQCEVGAHVILDFERSAIVRSTRGGSDRDREARLALVRAALDAVGVEFIEQNGGGPGVRLRDVDLSLTKGVIN